MKLTRVHIIKAETCGELLNGLIVDFREPPEGPESFDPFCLVGPNGTGKSQFLQVLAEAFQVVFYACSREEERLPGNKRLQFDIQYLISPTGSGTPTVVRLTHRSEGKGLPTLKIQRKNDLDWVDCPLEAPGTLALLPTRIIGYTSGDNETLSLPFLVSRSGYADDVTEAARPTKSKDHAKAANSIRDTRLMLIDYGTHIEVLVSNLIRGSDEVRAELLRGARLGRLHSFRCIVQLGDGPVAKLNFVDASGKKHKGVQLTRELEESIDHLRNCATCYDEDKKKRTYTFDFFVDDQIREAFGEFWDSAINLYTALHKLSMLNDLAIPRTSRKRLRRDVETRRFASRLPEPQDEDRVFRFEQVRFKPKEGEGVVDYVSLSDGEHQLAQILGTMCMISDANVLFLLDEPESHFNPQWRVEFVSRLMKLPTSQGKRGEAGSAPAQQDCLMTTHAPFVPSDMLSGNVLIFKKNDEQGEGNVRVKVERPRIETFGTTFDKILQVCFDVRPPISGISRAKIKTLEGEDNLEKLREGITELGDSVQKVFLMDRYRQLLERKGE